MPNLISDFFISNIRVERNETVKNNINLHIDSEEIERGVIKRNILCIGDRMNEKRIEPGIIKNLYGLKMERLKV